MTNVARLSTGLACLAILMVVASACGLRQPAQSSAAAGAWHVASSQPFPDGLLYVSFPDASHGWAHDGGRVFWPQPTVVSAGGKCPAP